MTDRICQIVGLSGPVRGDDWLVMHAKLDSDSVVVILRDRAVRTRILMRLLFLSTVTGQIVNSGALGDLGLALS